MTQVGFASVKIGLDNSNLKNDLLQSQSLVQKSMNSMKTILGGLAAGFTLGAIVNEFKNAYLAAEEVNKINRKLEAVLKSTGYAAGLTSESIDAMATSMMKLTGIDDEVIKSAATMMLTFTNVGKEVFPQATQAALDMAAVYGGDLQTNIIQIGKALNDPIKGVTALSKAGVQFTQQQKDEIEALIKTNRGLEAQKLILAELNKEFGGAAEAGKTFSMEMTTAVGNLQESLGSLMQGENAITTYLRNLAEGWQLIIDKMRIASTEINNLSFTDAQQKLNDVENKKLQIAQQYGGKKRIPEFSLDLSDTRPKNTYKALELEEAALNKQIQLLYKQQQVREALAKKGAEGNKNNFNTGKEGGGNTKAINLDLKTLGLDGVTSDYRQRLIEQQADIDADIAMSKKELSLKSELRKQGLLDTSRDFKDELALRIDFEQKKLDIANSVKRDTAAALASVNDKKKSDILNISSGNAPNKDQAISAITASAAQQVTAIKALSVEKEKALQESNKKELDAKRKLIEDLKKADEEAAARSLELVKGKNANDIIMAEQDLSNRIKAIHYQSTEEKLQIELNYIEKKKNLDIAQLNKEIEVNKLSGSELNAIIEQKHQIEEQYRIDKANKEQAANEEKIARERDTYAQLGNISANYLELMMNHELTKSKIAEMGQSALKQIVIGGFKSLFEEEKYIKLKTAFMETKDAATKGWTSGLAMAPAPFNLATAAGMATAAAAFPAANMAMIAASNYREYGGPVKKGTPYIVGEKRPEVFVPNSDGYIRPNTNGLDVGMSGGQQPQPIIIAQTFNIKAFDSKDVKQYLSENKSMIQNMVSEGIKDNQSNLRNAVRSV